MNVIKRALGEPADVISGPKEVTNSGLLSLFLRLHRAFGGMYFSGDLPGDCRDMKATECTKVPPPLTISGRNHTYTSGLEAAVTKLHRGVGSMLASTDIPQGCSESKKTMFTKVPPTNVISGPQEITKRALLQLCVRLYRRFGGMFFSSDLPEACSKRANITFTKLQPADVIKGREAVTNSGLLRLFMRQHRGLRWHVLLGRPPKSSESKTIMFTKVPPTNVISGPPEVTKSALLQLCVGLNRRVGAIWVKGDLPEVVRATDLLLGSRDVLLLLVASVVLAVLMLLIGLVMLCVRYRQPSADEQPETKKQAASRVKWSLCFWLWRLLHEFPRYCVAVYDVERDDFEHICPRESAPLLRVVRKLVTATGAVLGRVTTPSPLGPWPSSMRIKSQAWGPERCVGGCSGVEDSGGGGGSPNTPRR
ncbi:hypothetical protein HPB49_024113 [Dermacentor silvarum]|uniref:Uncharacterized protein n=1 Tax=Dermacentor silvarum TaxID=543639 RepID=A0ACB8CTU4_DERSI|nr:hypothetical protein HPB49_024113 [Dermacentor silvarum]